jgi:hypothetical protein
MMHGVTVMEVVEAVEVEKVVYALSHQYHHSLDLQLRRS